MVQADVAVIGAGPAGSVAAYCLAVAGAKVVLLEQATFPRDKACGDGVMSDGLSILGCMGLAGWMEQFQTMDVLRLTSPDAQVLDVDLSFDGAYLGRVIPRRLLDAKLVQAAVGAGVHLMEGARVRTVERTEKGPVHIAVNGFAVQAELVILADGSNAPVTRRLGLAHGYPELFAMRQYLAGDVGPSGRLEIHFQSSIVPGYNWLFPVGDGVVNVGTGTYWKRLRVEKIALKQELSRFVADPILDNRLISTEPAGPLRGHPLRTSLRDTHTHAPRCLVVGDAAGLISPFTGEGIAAALQSGKMAASQALAALKAGDFSEKVLAPYSHALRARYQVDQAAARMLRMVLSNPWLLDRVFQGMCKDEKLALLFAKIFLDKASPRFALRPRTLLRLLWG